MIASSAALADKSGWTRRDGLSPSEISKEEYAALADKSGWTRRDGFFDIAQRKGYGAFRLPTEAEWEYAARAGTTTAFNLGENISPDIVNYNGNYPYENAAKGLNRRQTVAVGSLNNANSWGLSDMHGNVWEWTSDWFYRYSSSSVVTDPKGPNLGFNRVMRGGSWADRAQLCRSAKRGFGRRYERFASVGFRVVRDN
jgi:formylglycine-generating enzyme required for sulfatase activity